MRRPSTRILIVSFCLLAAAAVFSAELPDTQLKTTAVAVFKNGLGFFVRQGTAKLAAGQGRIPLVPQATLGTLWLAPNDPGTTIEELVAYRYSVAKEHATLSLDELLQANTGKMATVLYNQKEYTGEILGLGEPDTLAALSAGGTEGSNPPLGAALAPASGGPRPQSSLLLMKIEGRMVAMNRLGVTVVSLPENPNLKLAGREELKALRFRLKGAGDTANLTMGYLQKGLGWTPSYLISLQDEKNAQITMQAVVTNDVEDLTNTELYFVVGVPNFAFAETPSPMALQQSLAELMDALRRDQAGRREAFSNALTGQRTVSAREEDAEFGAPSFSAAVGELVGAPEEDLFLYTRGGVTLARGERATYNVFAGTVAYEHIYEWDIQDTSRVDRYGNPQGGSGAPGYSDRGTVNNIWHSLRLKNSTKFPWTSAPALVISGSRPISQDTLFYTPKGASSNLRLTVATDIRASHQELEVERQPRVMVRPNYYYDVVTVEGTLKVRNHKSKGVRLTIRKALLGSVLSASDDGKPEKLAEALRTENPSSRITWEVALGAGEEKTITYRYKILIRV